MAKNEVDPGVWAVAIWENVNPNIDYVSVQIQGLSNAYRLKDPEKKTSFAKTLQLNFWRPGDAVGQQRDDLTYGVPLVDDAREQIRICKFYDLPGNNEGQKYVVELEPQFWEPDFGQIRFIKTLDYLWIYR